MSYRQNSIFSFGSLALTSKYDELCYEDMTKTELQQALKNIACSNLLLQLENDVFERHLARRDPESLHMITQILETAKRVQRIAPVRSPTSPVMSVNGSVTSVRDKDAMSVVSIESGSQPSILTAKATKGATKITYSYRIEMVNTEIRELLKALIELEQKWKEKKIYFQAHMEENEISIHEICKVRDEFEENVVQKGIDNITGKIPAEKFIRFIEEWLKIDGTKMERIRLKMTTIKSQIRKSKLQLKQREEFGEALRAIDFEQLNIENQDCIRKLDEKNQHLSEMKKIAGRCSISLTKHKEKLTDLMSTANKVQGKIIFKKQEMIKLQSERAVIELEIKKAEKQFKMLMTLMDDFNVPDIIYFVKMSAELQKLYKIHKQLNRQRFYGK